MFFSIVGQAVVGWLIADLLSGVVHWYLDRVATVTLPVIGQTVVAPNRRHHHTPLAFLSASIFERNLAMWLLVAVVSAAWLWLLGPSVVWAAATIGAALANEVHGHAHRPMQAPALVRVAQDIGIIQSPRHHSVHHRAPQDRNYCSLTDLLNPLLDHFKVWARLEAGFARAGRPVNAGK